MAFSNLDAGGRIVAVHVDIMKHSNFSLLGGITQIGKVIIDDSPTAGTDGRDVYYGKDFVMGLTRKQLRMLVCHEQMHKALSHCTAYKAVCEKHPQLSNIAMDHVCNLTLEEMDIKGDFMEWIVEPPPLIDARFKGMSFLEVLSILLREQKAQPQQDQAGQGKPLDKHMPGQGEPEAGEGEEAEGQSLEVQIQDALAQGKIVSENLKRQRGEGGGGQSLTGMQDRQTDWRKPLRRFVQEVAEGDDQSRYCPPNKRMLPLGILLPSHFSESTGEILVAVDTSGSMSGILPVVFGELCAICKSVKPSSVRVIWWDSCVRGVQVFTAKDYDSIAKLVKPMGGGGTTVSCVAQYVKEKKLRPRCTIIVSDGFVESQYESPPGPLLWGIVDNPGFRPLRGKKVDISSYGSCHGNTT